MTPFEAQDAMALDALACALGIDRVLVEDAMQRAQGDLDLFRRILAVDPARMEVALEQAAMLAALGHVLVKLFHTPLGQLQAEADAYRASHGEALPVFDPTFMPPPRGGRSRVPTQGLIVGTLAEGWALQAYDYAFNTNATYIATAYMKPPPEHIYDARARWAVYTMPSRQALDDWYGSLVGSPDRYHYLATFDKTTPEWGQGKPVAAATGTPDAYVGGGPMNSHNYVGANGYSYPEIAAHAVASAAHQSPSPLYGYHRVGMQQKIYLFGAIADAQGWFAALVQGQGQPYDYAAVFAATDLSRPVPGLESFGHTAVSGGAYVGADGSGSYPDVASRAVTDVQQQTPSPFYGYLRTGAQQKIYLFHTLDQGSGWFATIVHGQAQPYDYAAVFAATDLSQPVAGLESFGHTAVSGDPQVGGVLPFLLGLPAGAVAGYFLRKWQEEHPGQVAPGLPPGALLPPPKIPAPSPKTPVGGPWLDINTPYVGGPWLDINAPHVGGPWLDINAPYVGGPWLDLVSPYANPWLASAASPSPARFANAVGASYGASPYERPYRYGEEVDRRRSWSQTRALIEAAKREVVDYNASYPAAAWVWALDTSGSPAVPGVQLQGGVTAVTPFSSHDQALDYIRSRTQTPHIALALFDTQSAHWPNPVNWTKSDDLAYEPIIAQRIAMSPPRMAGDFGGPSIGAAIDTALDDVRSKAASLAARRTGSVIGVIHTSKDGLWHTLAFRSADDADDWVNTATQDPASYTYAAYFDKGGESWPHAYIEKISGMRAPPGTELRRRTTTSGRAA